ncbi:MAG: FecR domain-containing protein [Arcobacter sp.]|uniref:FecR domain-containing protein n=1 Tax=Arcobacter sp. TaxID=1872629 RepID=UPI003AFF9D1D
MKKIIILLFILTNILFASIGQITALVGEIKISRDSKELLAKLGEELEKNDVINSSKGAKAQITLDDNTIITIGQNSTLNIFDYVFDESKPKDSKASFGFMKGSFKSITGKIGKINKDRFKLKTKSASIGIRGTTIIGNQRMIACTDGAISVSANGVTVNVGKQELTKTPEGQAPTPAEPLTPETLNTLEKESNGGNDNGENTDTGNSNDGGDGEESNNEGGNTDDENGNDAGGGVTSPDVEAPDTNDDDKKDDIDKEVDTSKNSTNSYTGKELSTKSNDYEYELTDTKATYSSTNEKLNISEMDAINTSSDSTTSGVFTQLSFDDVNNYGLIAEKFINEDGNNYVIEADKLGEFIVGHNTSEYGQDLWYLGTNANPSALDTSKIYVYDDYVSLKVDINGGMATNAITENPTGLIFLNSLTKSIAYLDKDKYEEGASYDGGHLNSDGTFTLKSLSRNYFIDINTNTTDTTNSSNVEGSLYGSENQGIGYNIDENITVTNSDTLNSYISTDISSSKTVGAAFLSTSYSNTNTDTVTLSGTSSGIYENAPTTSNQNVNLTVNQSTGDISGSIGNQNYDGNVDDLASYFITEDLFAVMASTGDGYLNALPDMVISESYTDSEGVVSYHDNIYMVDDGSSWGYWYTTDNYTNLSGYSTWVAGVETSTSYMNNITDSNASTTSISFNGHIIGAVKSNTDNSLDPIVFDSNNYANFNFDFGGGADNFTGSIGFKTENAQQWAVLINSGTVTATSFSSTDITKDANQASAVSITGGSINSGKYFDSNIQSVGANVTLNNSSYTASGVVKAKAQ